MSTHKKVTHRTDSQTWYGPGERVSHSPGIDITVDWRTGYADLALAQFEAAVTEIRQQIADVKESQ